MGPNTTFSAIMKSNIINELVRVRPRHVSDFVRIGWDYLFSFLGFQIAVPG